MKNKYTFLSMFRAEHYKSKYNYAVNIMLLLPLFITLLATLWIVYKADENSVVTFNPWIGLLGRYIFSFYMLLPIFISILCYSLCDMEYRNNSIKQLFTLPYSQKSIYLSKLLYLVEVIFITSLIAYVAFMVAGYLLSYTYPVLSFADYDIRNVAFHFFSRLFICLLAIAVIQFCLSLAFRSFVVPVGFGCFMTILSNILHNNWKYDYLVPYCSLTNTIRGFYSQTVSFDKFDYICIGFIPVLSIIGYILMVKKFSR